MNSPQNNDNFIHAPINTFYVAEDGNWGQSDVVLFDRDALTEAQWRLFELMNDGDRFDYMVALQQDNLAHVALIEQDYAD